MGYIGIVMMFLVVFVGGIFLYVKLKNRKYISSNTVREISTFSVNREVGLVEAAPKEELVIEMEMIPMEIIRDGTKLVEITNSEVLARINSLIPDLARTGHGLNKTAQAIKAGNREVLYRVILPAGAKLTNSKTMDGAVRGIYHGVDGIKGHANFVAEAAQNGGLMVVNTVDVAMNVASMVVGQYYMAQIDSKLGKINDSLSRIQSFQDNEHRSRVLSLMAHVKRIADFKMEILENVELRLSKITQLDSLEEECTKLLGQANLMIGDIIKENNLDYEAYEKALVNAQSWLMYQKSLLEILYRISDLRYTLHLGAISRAHSNNLLLEYNKQVRSKQECLTAWHNEAAQRLGIEIDKIRRKRLGIEGVFWGLFNSENNFHPIDKEVGEMIVTQTNGNKDLYVMDTSELYADDVQLILKDGQIYYLPRD